MTYESLSGQQEPNLDFMVRFDGTQPEISEAEQGVVADKFDSLVEDTILTHLADMETSFIGSRLHLRKPDARGFDWRIEPDKPFYATAVLFVCMSDPSKSFEERHRYFLGREGTVRRQYFQTPYSRLTTKPETSLEETLVDLFNENENVALGTQLGITNQPVGLSEIEGLIDFVQQPGFVVDRSRYLSNILTSEE